MNSMRWSSSRPTCVTSTITAPCRGRTWVRACCPPRATSPTTRTWVPCRPSSSAWWTPSSPHTILRWLRRRPSWATCSMLGNTLPPESCVRSSRSGSTTSRCLMLATGGWTSRMRHWHRCRTNTANTTKPSLPAPCRTSGVGFTTRSTRCRVSCPTRPRTARHRVSTPLCSTGCRRCWT